MDFVEMQRNALRTRQDTAVERAQYPGDFPELLLRNCALRVKNE